MCWSLLVCECMFVGVYWCVNALEFIGVCVCVCVGVYGILSVCVCVLQFFVV